MLMGSQRAREREAGSRPDPERKAGKSQGARDSVGVKNGSEGNATRHLSACSSFPREAHSLTQEAGGLACGHLAQRTGQGKDRGSHLANGRPGGGDQERLYAKYCFLE